MDANAPNSLKIRVLFNGKAFTQNFVKIGLMILGSKVGHKQIWKSWCSQKLNYITQRSKNILKITS
jgi:hypothetical protein